MDYNHRLDTALQQLRQLNLKEALRLLHQLLADYPDKLSLIEQIFKLEKKRPNGDGFAAICRHIFSVKIKEDAFQPLFLEAYQIFSEGREIETSFSESEVFKLLHQLTSTHLINDCAKFAALIKTKYPENSRTPDTLLRYAESLIRQKHLISAREELKHLVTFYTETPAAQQAVSRLIWVKGQIR